MSDDYGPVNDWIGDDFATWLSRQGLTASYFAARKDMDNVESAEDDEEQGE